MIKRALISVSDKTGVIELAQLLQKKQVEILSTGGTAKLLSENNIEVVEVGDYTGFPEMMDGRVKTLHPKIHGGLLAVRNNDQHMAAAEENGVGMIDLVVVNLYPFKQTIEKEAVSLEEAIEQIDIGGPSMLRSAAKNYQFVTVVTEPSDYERVMEEIQSQGNTTPETRRKLAEKVFVLTAQYDAMIAHYLTEGQFKSIPLKKVSDLRYGENPHQEADFYQEIGSNDQVSLAEAKQYQGKELSYNNIMDSDAALATVREFVVPAVVFLKHANPCGVATANTLEEAYDIALDGDSKSAFGGIIALNRKCTSTIAEKITSRFFEVVLAPDFQPEALEILKKKKRLRVMNVGPMGPISGGKNYKKVSGGLLVQDLDTAQVVQDDLQVVTQKTPTDQEVKDLLFAWHVLKHVKSNGIVLAKENRTVGIGAGQMSRVDAVELAVKKAGGRQQGSVMASDAFFPFPDGVEAAAKAGITAIIQPGGSIKDEEVIKAANDLGVAMVFTGKRAFLH